MLRSLQVLLVISGMGFVFACADEAEDRTRRSATTRAEAPGSAARVSEEEAAAGVPEIRDLRLRPEVPVPGRVIRAVVRLTETAHDAKLDYEWAIDGDSNYPNAPSIQLPGLKSGSRVSVRVVASNEEGESESHLAVGTVPNAPPKITRLEVLEVDLEDGSQGWRAEVRAEDPNGDTVELRYTWFINDRASNQRKAVFSTAELKRGDRVYVEVVAHDDTDESRTLRSGVLGIANVAPEITSLPTGLSSSGTFNYQIEVEDADGDRDLRFALEAGPSGMQLGPGGLLRWNPEIHQVGDHQVIVSVSDGRGGQATQEFVIPVRLNQRSGEPTPAAID